MGWSDKNEAISDEMKPNQIKWIYYLTSLHMSWNISEVTGMSTGEYYVIINIYLNTLKCMPRISH